MTGQGEMTKTTLLNRLFDDWETRYFRAQGDTAPFIRDGIIREDIWDGAELKIAFLLKEINKGKHEGLPPCYQNDFRMMCDAKPWAILGGWAYALQQTESTMKGTTKQVDYDGAYRSSAIINLKKTAGTASTDWTVLRRYAFEEKERLGRQLEIIDPRIVLCGGRANGESVFQIARDIGITTCGPENLMGSGASKGISTAFYYDAPKRRVWIDFVHPSVRGKHLKGTTQEELRRLLAHVFSEVTSSSLYKEMISR